jgi:multiple sugar transport system substrate-binding protein
MKKFLSKMRNRCLFSVLIIVLFSACNAKSPLDPKHPVTISMWHNFGGDMQQTMDFLIDEFNATVGREEGIIVSVDAIMSSANLQEAVNMIVAGDPGAPQMPDIMTAYPRTAILFQNQGRLANLDNYFTKEELSAYIPAFVNEGRLGDGGLYVFPFAKSTELLFVNQTFFDRFSAETGITMDCFATFEGIADAAMKYYEWTNNRTPEIPRDHKQFFSADSWLNIAQSGMLQQGMPLFNGEVINFDTDEYRRIWENFYDPTVKGGIVLYDGYSSDLSKTGDIICSVGSSAGILFYSDRVAYPDNRTEQVQYNILPYPVFEGGNKTAIQRGNGFIVAASDEKRETAAAVFLKWFTAPEQNMRFVAETGYLPVTNEAFETQMPQRISTVENPHIRQLLETATSMYAEYDFYTAPVFEKFDAVSDEYEERYKDILMKNREAYLNGGGLNQERALADFTAIMRK